MIFKYFDVSFTRKFTSAPSYFELTKIYCIYLYIHVHVLSDNHCNVSNIFVVAIINVDTCIPECQFVEFRHTYGDALKWLLVLI